MRVAIDALIIGAGGGVTYFQNLLPTLAEMDRENQYLILCSEESRNIVFELPDNFQYLKIPKSSPPLIQLWRQVKLPVILKKYEIDVLYSSGDISPVFSPCKVMLAIRNFNLYTKLETKKGFKNKFRVKLLRSLAKLSAAKAQKVIFVSNYSRDIISRQLKISSKSVAIYHGLSDRFNPKPVDAIAVAEHFQIGIKPYILSVSTIFRHKNYVNLIEAYALLRDKDSIEFDLIIVGGASDKVYLREMQEAIDKDGLQQNVHLLGEVEYSKIHLLYKGAKLFVLPSYLETFGHPLVEAMASGIPVITSNTSVIREICEDAALYFDPFNPEDIAKVMYDALTDELLRKEMRQCGLKQARRFSWVTTAQKTLEVLKSVYET